MLTACDLWSQGATPDSLDTRPITFPFWMVKEMAIDLAEKDRLQALQLATDLELQIYAERITGFEKVIQAKDLQLGLLEKNNVSLTVQLEAEKAKKPKDKTFLWILRLIGAAAVGFVAGSL